ncbi:hypothetical protein ABZ369_09865 [Streptomyces sp. NPDC005918]|uniref:hypothetical protein n=2 Tax=unclassified Streptomyces TaxID=2593676 RepID=UPI0033E0C94E
MENDDGGDGAGRVLMGERSLRRAPGLLVVSLLVLASVPVRAHAWGEDVDKQSSAPSQRVGGDASGRDLMASVSHSRIELTRPGGRTAQASMGELRSVDPNWRPPTCWYEPVFSPEQLKATVATGEGGLVNAHVWWSNRLWVDHYGKGKPARTAGLHFPRSPDADGYKNYNLGKKGMFWRSTVRKGKYQDSKAWDCGRVMFWQPAGAIPEDAYAPTPETLAAFAYDRIRVPDTRVELKPAHGSTVNLPTWMWLDKGTFKAVGVRADLPGTGLYAVTTATPVALHLQPGTDEARTYPASGDCEIGEDGSIGTPYSREAAATGDPHCGVEYLRATDGRPYQLTASVTWAISWKGTGGATGDLPNGTFESTQDVHVQEIQSVNR